MFLELLLSKLFSCLIKFLALFLFFCLFDSLFVAFLFHFLIDFLPYSIHMPRLFHFFLAHLIVLLLICIFIRVSTCRTLYTVHFLHNFVIGLFYLDEFLVITFYIACRIRMIDLSEFPKCFFNFLSGSYSRYLKDFIWIVRCKGSIGKLIEASSESREVPMRSFKSLESASMIEFLYFIEVPKRNQHLNLNRRFENYR